MSNNISKPELLPKVPQRQKCHQDIILPQTGWNPNTLARYVPLLACGLLELHSLTHTLKDLPISPIGNRG